MTYAQAKQAVFEEMERWLPLNYPMDGKARKLFWRAKNTAQPCGCGIWDVYRDVPVKCEPNTFDFIVRAIEADINFDRWWIDPYGQYTVTKVIYEEKGLAPWFPPVELRQRTGVEALLCVYPVVL